jgi:hypothetical protein
MFSLTLDYNFVQCTEEMNMQLLCSFAFAYGAIALPQIRFPEFKKA